MSTHHVPPVYVAHLKAKLGALYYMSSDIDSDAALGRQFVSEDPKGISAKAVRHWIFGDETRQPGEVPSARFENLVAVFQRRLPGKRTMDETRALLLNPSSHPLVAAFQPLGPQMSWVQRMLAAPPAAAQLLPAPRPGSLSITTRRALIDTVEAGIEFPIGRPFQLQLDMAAKGWLTVLQWGQHGCHGVELDDNVVSLHRIASETPFPMRRPYFQESEVGPKRFLFLSSSVPLPPDIASCLSTSACAPAALDGGTLERLAHLASEPGGVELTSLDVYFTAHESGKR